MSIFSFIFVFRNFFLFVTFLFQNDGIVITHNIPKSIKPGETIDVEVKIKKNTVTGFAKFNLDLPEGFTIKEKENAGSSFSQQGTIAKWIWTVLPATDEIVLKFSLTVSPNVRGMKSIGGKFSYILNNEKALKEMEVHNIQVGDGILAQDEVQKEQEKTNLSADSSQLASKDSLSNLQNYAEPLSQPEITRKVEKISDLEYRIYLTIKKGKNISGFAKFSDNLPESMNARALQTDGASFSVADYRVKFVWVNVPEKEVLNISYVLNGKPTESDYLLGEWVYLENDQSKKVVLTKWTWKDSPLQTNTPDKSNVNNVTENKINDKNNQQIVQNQDDDKKISANDDNKLSGNDVDQTVDKKNSLDINASDKNKSGTSLVIFKVQVGAFRTPIQSPAVFARKRLLGQIPVTELADGFTKYIIGKFEQYKLARDKRESVRSTVPSAFVVAYNGSTRITVQEALMITNQKWIK